MTTDSSSGMDAFAQWLADGVDPDAHADVIAELAEELQVDPDGVGSGFGIFLTALLAPPILLNSLFLHTLIVWNTENHLATLLELLGIYEPVGFYYRIRFDRIQDLLERGADLVTEDGLNAIAGLAEANASSHRDAVLASMLVAIPRMIRAAGDDRLRMRLPDLEPSDPTSTIGQLLSRTDDWTSLTLALMARSGPNGQTHVIRHIYEAVSGAEPDQTLSLAIRGGPQFEAWVNVHPSHASLRFPLSHEGSWQVTVDPAQTHGIGHVDDVWHGHIDGAGPGRARARIRLSPEQVAGPDILIGSPTSTHLRIHDLELYVETSTQAPVFSAGVVLKELRAFLTPDAFRTEQRGDERFPLALELTFDAAMTWNVENGLRFDGSGGAEMLILLDRKIAGMGAWTATLHSLTLRLDLQIDDAGAHFRLQALNHASIGNALVRFVASGFGSWGGQWRGEQSGITGVTGLGCAAELGPVILSAYLEFKDPERQAYAGIGYARIGTATNNVILHGYFATERYEGKTSLFGALGLKLAVGIPVGAGLVIRRLGCLLGLHRRFDTDALVSRLSIGPISSLLSVPDPIRDGPRLFADIDAIFPPARGVFLAGLNVGLEWAGGLTKLDVGLMFEFISSDGPHGSRGLSKIAILGTLSTQLEIPDVLDLIDIRVECIGVLDLQQPAVSLDLSISSASLFGLIRLTGDGAVRMSNKVFVISLGGFHPDYDPTPAQLPMLARMGVYWELNAGIEFSFRLEAYIAQAWAGFQFGARSEARLWAGVADGIGYFGFDALLQFDPVYFSVSVHAGFRFRVFGFTIANIRLDGTLSAPPITLSVRFTLELLFVIDLKFRATIRLGPRGVTVQHTHVPNLVELIREELGLDERWGVPSEWVSGVLEFIGVSRDTFDPGGVLEWTQNQTPLDTLVERVQGRALGSAGAVVVTSSIPTKTVRMEYAAGMFADLTEAEALERTTFERLPTGLRFVFETAQSSPAEATAEVAEFVLENDDGRIPPLIVAFADLLLEAVRGRNAAMAVFPRATHQVMVVHPEAWVVHDASVEVATNEMDAHQRARHQGGVALPAAEPLIELGAL